MYSSMSASFIAPSPIARRAEKPVPTPKSMRPGARPFNVANARGDAVRGHEHAGAEADLRGLHRRRRHRDEGVGGDHLRVVEPGVREAELLGALRRLPRVAGAGDTDAEIHQRLPFSRAAHSIALCHHRGTEDTE